ncbi:MAG: hypothetical protein IAE80_09510 [Anaerolinea sp.]|nr:hypothetical protein [Anaerolinea sp.]
MSRVETALQTLFEDPSVRDELHDDEANELFKWAEGELGKLESVEADDAAFEEKVGELRRLLRGMNRLVGRRADLSAQADDEALVKLTDHANALGYALTPAQLAASAGEIAALDAKSAIQRLTGLISGTDTPAHAHTEPPPEQEPPSGLASLLGRFIHEPPPTPDLEDHHNDQTFDQ